MEVSGVGAHIRALEDEGADLGVPVHQFTTGGDNVVARRGDIEPMTATRNGLGEFRAAFGADKRRVDGSIDGLEMRGCQVLRGDGNDTDAFAGWQGSLHPWHLHQ